MYDSDNNKALVRLLESADLVKMLEDLIAPSALGKLSPAVLSGVRVTLRNVREAMLSCHDSFAAEQTKAANRVLPIETLTLEKADESQEDARMHEASQNQLSDSLGSPIEFASKTSSTHYSQPAMPVRRNDLRSSLQKIVERA
jgi:hypothetical protein